jgi:predicted transcriptional regulator
MDPLTISTAFATLVQLLGIYRQERGARRDLDHRDFIEWLENHRHEEIKELITRTFHLQSQIDDLLRQDHAEILTKLDEVNQIVFDILAHVEGFSAITSKVVPDAGISANAVQILVAFVQSRARVMVHTKPDTIMFAEVGGGLEFPDSRFLSDDLASLEGLGLIAHNESSGAKGYYRLTRRGAQFIEMQQRKIGSI